MGKPYPEKIDIGKPLSCDPAICDIDTAPVCLNFETPTYGSPGIELIRADHPDYPYNKTEFKWKRRDDAFTTLIPRAERGRPECKHIDHCGGWSRIGRYESGWLVFRLPKLRTGRILFCCKGKQGAREAIEE